MKVAEVRKLIKKHGLTAPARARKADLIHQLQEAEGNFPCFGTPQKDCDQKDCLWRMDCLPK